jgi:hypothetical protein
MKGDFGPTTMVAFAMPQYTGFAAGGAVHATMLAESRTAADASRTTLANSSPRADTYPCWYRPISPAP